METLRKLLAQTRQEYEKKLADQYARLTGQLTKLGQVNDKVPAGQVGARCERGCDLEDYGYGCPAST